jgi:hypothetical protein
MGDTVDIAVLRGMTPAWETGLRALDFHTSADLLRANRSALVAAFPALPLLQLRQWQAFAQLLEVDGAVPDLCDLFLNAGIGSLDELASRKLSQLQAIVAGSSMPMTDDSLAAILQDAVRLKSLGVLNVNVADADGHPLAGATASCEGQHATSDARGRLRFVRIRLGVPLTMELAHPVRGAKVAKGLRAAPLTALQGVTIAFPRRSAAPRSWSALRGDTLPALGSAPISTAAQAGPPAHNDVLRLIDRYTNGDARVASRFFDYADGRFIVRTYRMPQSLLPAGLQEGDDILHDGSHWMKERVSARKIARLQRLRSIKRPWPPTSGPTPAQLDKYVKQVLAATSD